MASYLTTATIGEFDVSAYRRDGIRYWDAIDPDLLTPPAPRTGEQFAISQKGEPAFKRLARTISVPAGGAQLSFWVTRDTEANWDFLFVEAHPVGSDDWTTLPDLNGHTSDDTGLVCPYWLGLHPFLAHYQTDNGDGTCSPTGTTGEWWAASGSSDGYEQWAVDLSAYAGSTSRSRSATRATTCSSSRASSSTTSSCPRAGLDLVRGRRRHAGRLDRSRRSGGQRAQPERLDRRHGGRHAADHG